MRLLLIFENKSGIDRCKGQEIKDKLKSEIGGLNDLRIDKNHLEVDLFSEDVSIIEKIASILKERIIQVIDLNSKIDINYNMYLKQRRFWEAHESLEEIWKNVKDKREKDSIRVSIQFCAAMVHYQRCNDSIAREIIKRALKIDSDNEIIKRIIGVDLSAVSRDDPDLEAIMDQMAPLN